MQGLLQRLASATQPFNFRVLSDNTAAARHIAEATVNTGTYEQLLRAAVAAIVRPSSRSSQPLCCVVLCCLCYAAGLLITAGMRGHTMHLHVLLYSCQLDI